jgi:hypothetical protein
MPARVFRDTDGVEWRVWSVIPGSRGPDERRRGYDRRSPDPVLRYSGEERRTGSERRERQALLAEPLRAGWLVFESDGGRHRLAPIPPAWDRLDDNALGRLCRRATNGYES